MENSAAIRTENLNGFASADSLKLQENLIMRTAAAVLALLIATTAAAQETTPADAPRPDYTREKLTQIFSHVVEAPPKPDPTVNWHLGDVEFRALNMRWRMSWLPLLAPLPGSIRGTVPGPLDPFAMTGTVIPYTPRTWHDQRSLSKELQRIERMERERAKIRVKSE
jgi:hypothetical protein